MRFELLARALALHIPAIGAALGLISFALPELLGSYEWGLTHILSLKFGGLLLVAISVLTLIFRFQIRQKRVVTAELIRVELAKFNLAK